MTAREERHPSDEAPGAARWPTAGTVGQRWQAFQKAAQLFVAVGAGSVAGGTARWLITELLHAVFPGGLPWGTLFVNVTGSFLIGFYAALTGPDGRIFAGPVQRQFVMTGFCGGYTTFSAFSLESIRLIQSGQMLLGSINVAMSLVLWLVAIWGGFALATRLSRLGR